MNLFPLIRKYNIKQYVKWETRTLKHSSQQKFSKESPKHVEELIYKHGGKIIFSSFINKTYSKAKYIKGNTIVDKLKKLDELNSEKHRSVQPSPVFLKYLNNETELNEGNEDTTDSKIESAVIQFPFSFNNAEIHHEISNFNDVSSENTIKSEITSFEIVQREKLLRKMKHNWMTCYEYYVPDLDHCEENSFRTDINYGTPDPNSKISNVPCGGCGALLHCKDTAIPGYIPSEIFNNYQLSNFSEIKSIVCQRCFFLKEFNTALQVRVSPEEYPKVLQVIKKKMALVLLLVDLLDFPCSIWPGITDIIGLKKPIIVVGNKVDLLPPDSKSYLNHVKSVLTETINSKGLDSSNIAHVALISAATGWGVEELITKIHNIWGTKGDVYLVGCTNVGKSTLFNTLLQSDFCKVKASDLIQRATTSCWPGTTLNLLKFPILRPSGWRLFLRTKRLQSNNRIAALERKLRKDMLRQTKDPQYATLLGHIDKTYVYETAEGGDQDLFAAEKSTFRKEFGIDENHPDYALGKWCYDTPGVIQPDQIIHLLTAEELIKTLPRNLIRPFSLRMKLGLSIFIGGLARLDYTEGPESIILTVFRSEHLPITVCKTEDAPELYDEFLGTEMFAVPEGNTERLKAWPKLKSSKPISIESVNWHVSCGDIVLSNAGWVSVTCGAGNKVVFLPWTPEGRGIYSRKCLLPFAVSLKGRKIKRSLAYECDRFFVKN